MTAMPNRALALLLACLLCSAAGAEESARNVRFERTQIDAKFRSEGVAAGDFNKDGRIDIAAGFVWYEAPQEAGGEWKMHAITDKAPEHDPRGYSNSFCTWAEDLNGDGWTDILVVDFPGTPTWWFENPKGADQPWARHTITPVTNNESPTFLDLDGDGQRELICAVAPDTASSDGPQRQMAYLKRTTDPYQPWKIHPISAKGAPGTTKYSHGLGVGDVNGDGRNDILVADGWWEAPADKQAEEWDWHGVNFNRLAHITDPRERLIALIRHQAQLVVRDPALFSVFFDQRSGLADEDMAELGRKERRYVRQFVLAVEAAMDAGVIPKQDARATANTIIGMTSWSYKWFDPRRDSAEDFADLCVALIVRK